jgi:hypothetical protein
MDALSRDLAAKLADRLNQIVPAGLSVRSENASLAVYSRDQNLGGSAALTIIDNEDGRSLEEKIEIAVTSTLSGIQDCIVEALTGSWPGQSGPGPDLPLPDCRIVGDQLRVWFGDEKEPVISLPSIRVH